MISTAASFHHSIWEIMVHSPHIEGGGGMRPSLPYPKGSVTPPHETRISQWLPRTL